ncbi:MULTISPECIES: YrbL family protein [unclassified Ruegeria]|uniref:YrbL family protein n=1 Tax=unclassified Ruegeria TaxID=2625375 RepID=UPI0014880984|nr:MULTISPECIES: YrbL family protein [unclassified Ruegeria]
MLELIDKPVIAKGNRQHVYAHPYDSTLLVKVPQPGTFDARGHLPNTGWIERKIRRATMYSGFLREFREYLELKARLQEPGALLPICEVHGTTPTDLGLGLVYGRISDSDGNLPPTLHEMIQSGRLEPLHLKLLNEFFDTLIKNHVVLSNKNLSNIVFQKQKDGFGRFVWIDSFGCKQLVPLRKWSKWLNTRGLNKVRKQVVGHAERALTKRP